MPHYPLFEYPPYSLALATKIVEVARHRQVARMPPRTIFQPAGKRPAALFVDRQRKNPVVITKRVLHAVAVMGVEIDVENIGHPLV